jgi:hypothetical protein
VTQVSRYGTRKLREMVWMLTTILSLMVVCEGLGIAINGAA